MKLKTAATAIVAFTLTTAFAQGTSPAPSGTTVPLTPQRRMLGGRRGLPSSVEKKMAGAQSPVDFHQNLQDMEATLANMHAVLKEMHAKAATRPKDSLVKANLDLWELMVSHLDKQLQQLQTAEAARKDLEARRAAMYKQADAKVEAAARAAQAAQTSKFGGAPTVSSGVQNAAVGANEKAPATQIATPPVSTAPSPK